MKNSQKVRISLIVVNCVNCKNFLKAKTVPSVVRSIIPYLLKVLSDIPHERASQAVTNVHNLVLGSLEFVTVSKRTFQDIRAFQNDLG